MDRRRNNVKYNKNKHNNKNKNNNNNHNRNKTQNIEGETAPNSLQQNKNKLSAQERSDLNSLISLLVLEDLFKSYENPTEKWQQYVKIQNVLKRIQEKEAPLQRKRLTENDVSAAGGDKRLANIEKFYQWAKEHGIHYEGLEIQKIPDYDLGLVATRDIKKDELIFTIPRQLILSEENLEYEFVHQYFKFSNIKLAFTLMIESLKPDSFWKPYIDLLPDSYSTVLYYTPEEMAELKGSNVLSDALRLCLIIARLYVNIYNWPEDAIPFKGFKDIFNYDMLRWAVSTAMTRENLIPRLKPLAGEEAPSTIASLIPFWDMANHRNGFITSFFNVETQEMESKAQEDFKKGEQVFIYYGDRSNAELMTYNGFLNPQNPKDSVSIKLGLSASDPLFAKRNELLQLLNIPKNSELKVLPPPNHISPKLLGFVRVFNMNAEQLDHWIMSERAMDLLHIDCALETELESKTWQYLQIRLMLLLRAFPTSLEDDEKLFQGLKAGDIEPKRNYIQMMILEYRILEKRILAAALDYAKQRTKA
ncbi:SET domain containing 3 [Cochliomyia hominivorax]